MNRRALFGRFAAIAAAVTLAPAVKDEAAPEPRTGAMTIDGDVTIRGNFRVLAPDGSEMISAQYTVAPEAPALAFKPSVRAVYSDEVWNPRTTDIGLATGGVERLTGLNVSAVQTRSLLNSPKSNGPLRLLNPDGSVAQVARPGESLTFPVPWPPLHGEVT